MKSLFNRAYQKQTRRYLRSNMTSAETILWQHIRNKGLGVRIRRQFGIGPYVVDFYCPKKHCIIEIDGDTHAEADQQLYDQERENYFRSLGLQVIRFTNLQVYETLDLVLEHMRCVLNDLP